MLTFDVIVVGAGALGLATAATLQRRGLSVGVLAPDGPTASAQAAGMLAPAFESALERMPSRDAAFLKQARDLWPAFAEAHDLTLFREGAEWRGRDPEDMRDRLRACGFKADVRGGIVVTLDDWRIDPWQALAALRSGLTRVTGRLVRLAEGLGDWRVMTDTDREMTARQLVLATGWQDPECGIVLPEILPVRGQAVRLKGWTPHRAVRGDGIYVAPQATGSLIGATMEVGRTDSAPDPETTDRLLQRARAVCPELADAQVDRIHVGVRGASPDGWPYAGALRPNLAVALAPRRNGWLLAPLIAACVADTLQGRDPGIASERMRPDRLC